MELHVDLETGSDEQKQERCVGDVCKGARARHHDDPLQMHHHQEVVFFTPIFHLRNKKDKGLLCCMGIQLVPGHSWHNHHRRRHLLFLLGDCYEIGFLWVLERNIDVIKTRVLERELPEIGFPMLHGDVVFEHRDRQTSQYPGAVSC